MVEDQTVAPVISREADKLLPSTLSTCTQEAIAKARSRNPRIHFAVGSVHDDFTARCEVPSFDAIVAI